MKLCSKCNEKIGFLEKVEYIENQIVCIDCYRQYQYELNRKKLEIEAGKQKEEEEIRRKEKEKYQKMSIQELIRQLGNSDESMKRKAIKELTTRDSPKAVEAVCIALSIDDSDTLDWKWKSWIELFPSMVKHGDNKTLKNMIAEKQKMKKHLKQINKAIDNYRNNSTPGATEAFNLCIEGRPKLESLIFAQDDAINKLKSKKFEKMADRIEANLDGMSWQKFEDTILDALEGERNAARVGDKGIDGFIKDGTPIQIKQSQNIGRNVVDNFETAIRRYFSNDEKNKRGMIVAFSFTNGAYDEIIRAKDEDNLDIQLITADELDIKVKK
jgi:hypothetical protein